MTVIVMMIKEEEQEEDKVTITTRHKNSRLIEIGAGEEKRTGGNIIQDLEERENNDDEIGVVQ